MVLDSLVNQGSAQALNLKRKEGTGKRVIDVFV